MDPTLTDTTKRFQVPMDGNDFPMPAGFPFDDDVTPRSNIRSHLDDLAQRHPEFADHLRCPPWGGEMHSGWGRKRRGSGSCGEDEVRSQSSGGSDANPQTTDFEQQEQVEEPGPLRGRPRQNNLPQYGLRNTVDMGQQQHASEQEDKQGRGQRSWSAPPDNRSQAPRFVTRVDINPINPDDPSSSPDVQGKPPMAPNLASSAAEAEVQGKPPVVPKQQASNVRHIPIFVEGRDEPVISKDKAQGTPSSHSFGRSSPFAYHQQFQQPPHHVPPSGNAPQVNKPCSQESRQAAPRQQQAAPRQQQAAPRQQQAAPRQQQAAPRQQPSPQHPSPQQPSPQQPSPKQVPIINDPISKVKAVAKDVDGLMSYVEAYSGNSRKDKDYMYLDEMLTRNLLKLDDIETEGKSDVRQARKDVIGYIQKCIAALENKVPLEEQSASAPEKMVQEQEVGETAPGKMNSIQEDQTTNTLDTKMEAETIIDPIPAEAILPTQSDQNVEVPSSTTTEMDVAEQKPESSAELASQDEQKMVEGPISETSKGNNTVIGVQEMEPMNADEQTVTSTQQMEIVTSQVPDTTMVEGVEATASSTSCEEVPQKTVQPNQTVGDSSQQ